MEITRIVVSAQRKIPHPEKEFATLSSLASIEATLGPGENVSNRLNELQNIADSHVDRHMEKLKARIFLANQGERAKKASDAKADALTKKHDKGDDF